MRLPPQDLGSRGVHRIHTFFSAFVVAAGPIPSAGVLSGQVTLRTVGNWNLTRTLSTFKQKHNKGLFRQERVVSPLPAPPSV